MERHNSIFKVVFFALAGLVALLIFSVIALVLIKGVGPDDQAVIYVMIAPLLFAVALLSLIAILVHKDASKRGMDPWLWATVATFVPNLIGVIIYLIVRYSVKKTCVACGKGLQSDFMVCPYCGASQELLCPGCGVPTSPEWNMCPHCGHNMKTIES